MPLQHPFQCIQTVRDVGPDHASYIVAAAGPLISVFDSMSGSVMSSWCSATPQATIDHLSSDDASSISEPQAKRRKVAPTQERNGVEEDAQDNASGIEGQPQTQTSTTTSTQQQRPQQRLNVILLAAASSGGYFAAVTGEDKCVRVFQVQHNGTLCHLSHRCMPKRPSSIRLCNGDQSILVADKFGDVFLLPLHYTPGKDDILPLDDGEGLQASTAATAEVATKSRQPAATNLTVHTKGNLRALEQQREQAAKEQNKKTKYYTFPHALLLGHVSMITDIEYVTLAEGTSKRSYLISADRDEHIRVSRGIPQTHIIEGYCFGHEAFVNRLCVPSWDQRTLISGGGDDYLLVWDWLDGRIRQRLNLRTDDEETVLGPVTGLWAVPFAGQPIPLLRQKAAGAILVALERCSALRVFLYTHSKQLIPQPPVTLGGSALSLTLLRDAGSVLVSIDDLPSDDESTAPSSSSRNSSTGQKLVEVLEPSYQAEHLRWATRESETVDVMRAQGSLPILVSEDEKTRHGERKAIDDLLYSASSLKKGVGSLPEAMH
ncbi:tRNA (guanine-N(7)-)-methyltransferase non-catalytic subunit trm82 [Ascosphaera acerosa]|nr:tRNA (guanine-N(7)-)-methyltransferase non-catalytic subunit trm82 [Ascosphaera acerosa]